MRRPPEVPVAVLLVAATFTVAAGPGAAQVRDAEAVFSAHSPSVGKLEVFAGGSGAPAIVGTAFFVADNLLATNYHVINDVVYEPDRYTASVVLSDGSRHDVRVVAVSAPEDLALLSIDASRPVLPLSSGEPARGAPLYSLGHPADLAQSVVVGNFNGLVEHRATPRYHLTGALNPGMSGGPTLSAGGEVVGVNVSTAGNQLSFLVPAPSVAALLNSYASEARDDASLLERVADQFALLHEELVDNVLDEGFPSSRMGDFEVPTGLDRYLDCSARRIDEEDDLYEATRHDCEMSDYVLSTQDESFVLLTFTHFLIESSELSAFRFQALYEQFFQNLEGWLFGETDDTTDYDCERANVDGGGARLRVVLCARRNTRLASLHDVFVRTAVLGGTSAGVVSSLAMTGVPLEGARELIAEYLRGFRWIE